MNDKTGFSPRPGFVYVKIHESGGEVVVAICDEEILGTRLIDEEKGVVFYVDPYFYGGEKVSVEEALRILDRASIANLVGKRIVDAAIRHGFIHSEAVLYINNTPHAQFMVLK